MLHLLPVLLEHKTARLEKREIAAERDFRDLSASLPSRIAWTGSARNSCDTTMVSLDLALVYAKPKQGRVADLKQLAEEMHSIFESKEIHREALAALLLFQQAAREERLTVHHVEASTQYFKKARTNPSLRFKE